MLPHLVALVSTQAPVVAQADDPLALVKLAIEAVAARNWLLAVPFVLLLVVHLVRVYGSRRWLWLATDRGGALLALVTYVLGCVAGAALSPVVSPTAFLVAVIAAAVGGQALFTTLNKMSLFDAISLLLFPGGHALVQEADAAGKKMDTSPETPASKINSAIGG